jgi:hypothetical protein
VPAQSLLAVIEQIRTRGDEAIKKGLKPSWSDLQILANIDPKEIGHAITASNYSIQLVEEYLRLYKFKSWANHSNGNLVTEEDKKQRAGEIATKLCDHSQWKNHGHTITRDAAWDVCKLKIVKAEDTPGLYRAMRRMWALHYWIFENSLTAKIFVSDNYCLMRQDRIKIIQNSQNNGK